MLTGLHSVFPRVTSTFHAALRWLFRLSERLTPGCFPKSSPTTSSSSPFEDVPGPRDHCSLEQPPWDRDAPAREPVSCLPGAAVTLRVLSEGGKRAKG